MFLERISIFIFIFSLWKTLAADDSLTTIASPTMGYKIFTSHVTVGVIGESTSEVMTRDMKSLLEKSVAVAYTSLLEPMCSFRSVEEISLIEVIMENESAAADDDDNYEANATSGNVTNITTTMYSAPYINDKFLIGENITTSDSSTTEVVVPDFFLRFQMTIKCFDCPNDGYHVFNNNNESQIQNNSTEEESTTTTTCYWNDYLIAINGNVAPSTADFLQELKEEMASSSSSIEVYTVIEEDSIVESNMAGGKEDESSNSAIPCACPIDSYCTYTKKYEKDFWKVRQFDEMQLFHNCTCKDGFVGEDGWRCEEVNECELDPWPCAPVEDGGFCVDRHPYDSVHPMYKCGCIADYIADTNYAEDKHGIKHCVSIIENTTSPSTAPTTSPSEVPTVKETEIEITIGCSDERLIPSYLSFDVNSADYKPLENQREIIEQAVQDAYESAIMSSCYSRSLENVTMYGFKLSNGTYVNITIDADTSRYLEEEADDDEDNTFSSDGLNNTDDDDNVISNGLNLNFNFSVYFAMIMRCYGCPEDTLLFDDATRRRQRILLSNSEKSVTNSQRRRQVADDNEESCCEEDRRSRFLQFGVVAESSIEAVFQEELEKEIVGQGLDSIIPKIETIVEKKDEYLFEKSTVLKDFRVIVEQIEQEKQEIIKEIIQNKKCDDVCDLNTQQCADGGKCVCKDGFQEILSSSEERNDGNNNITCTAMKECIPQENSCDENASCEVSNDGNKYYCICNSKDGYFGNGLFCEENNYDDGLQSSTLAPTNTPTTTKDLTFPTPEPTPTPSLERSQSPEPTQSTESEQTPTPTSKPLTYSPIPSTY